MVTLSRQQLRHLTRSLAKASVNRGLPRPMRQRLGKAMAKLATLSVRTPEGVKKALEREIDTLHRQIEACYPHLLEEKAPLLTESLDGLALQSTP